MSRGFTLVELLIVLVVGMILAGTVIPAASTLDDQVLLADANVLVADLEFAQARAVATGQSHRILFDPDAESYTVESPPGTILDEPLSRRPWHRRLAEKGNTGIGTVNFGGTNAILFDAAGTPDNGGNVRLAVSREMQCLIEVAPVTGKVTLTIP